MKLGILTTRNNPRVPYLLDELAKARHEPYLIFDRMGYSEKNMAIFQERTRGEFPIRSMEPFLQKHEWIDVENHNSDAAIDYIQQRGIEILFNGGTPRRVGGDLLRSIPRGVLNCHPGLLPEYRGASCCEWAIYRGDPVGVTAHFMDERLDSGPILMKWGLEVRAHEEYISIRNRLYRLEYELLSAVLPWIERNDISARNLQSLPDGPVFKPISEEEMKMVRVKLRKGCYQSKAFQQIIVEKTR